MMFKIILSCCFTVLMFVDQSSAQLGVIPKCQNGDWSGWLDRDDPSLTGDWETWSSFPRKPCENPVAQHFELINPNDPPPLAQQLVIFPPAGGVACINDRGDRKCPDLKIRFCCPKAPKCDEEGYDWTDWYDVDDPTDSTGDYELLSDLVSQNQDRVCEKPTAIDAIVVATQDSWQSGGNVDMVVDTQVGLICKNEKQPEGICCEDYAVRFCCKLCPKKQKPIGTDLTTGSQVGEVIAKELNKDIIKTPQT
ncbi:uncharacterized protein LOC120340583 [Styela clava]